MRPTAAQLNKHLESGGVVEVTTTYRVTVYRPKHAGMFSERGGNLYVTRGKSHDCLSMKGSLLVRIRLGR